MTKRLEILERSPVRVSVRPSLKYSWSGSLLMLTKGRTTIEGLSGKGSAGCTAVLRAESGGASGDREKYRTAPTVAARSMNPTTSHRRAGRVLRGLYSFEGRGG